MIDLKLKYQASIFADTKHIKPTSDNISILLETFRDREFIPNIIQEIVVQRDFMVLRDFGWHYETLRLRRSELRLGERERVRLR